MNAGRTFQLCGRPRVLLASQDFSPWKSCSSCWPVESWQTDNENSGLRGFFAVSHARARAVLPLLTECGGPGLLHTLRWLQERLAASRSRPGVQRRCGPNPEVFVMVSEAAKRNRKYWNTVGALKRARKRLQNSMAHTPKPRPADMIRWRKMQGEIATLEAAVVELAAKGWPDSVPQPEESGHAKS